MFPSLTVRENLSLTARSGSEASDALAGFPELEKRPDSPTALLSGGEQQMVVLAPAFAARPRFLLVDDRSRSSAPTPAVPEGAQRPACSNATVGRSTTWAPPSTTRTAPLTYDDCAEPRKRTTEAISAGSAARPSGTSAVTAS